MPVATTIVLNIWIVCIVRKQIQRVYNTRKGLVDTLERQGYDKSLLKEISQTKNRKQLGLIRAFGGVLVGNIVVWTPFFFSTVILTPSVDVDLVPLGFYSFAYATFSMHSVLHPLIEGCFIPEMKHAFKAIIRAVLCRRKEERHFLDSVTSSEESSHGCCELCGFATVTVGSDELK